MPGPGLSIAEKPTKDFIKKPSLSPGKLGYSVYGLLTFVAATRPLMGYPGRWIITGPPTRPSSRRTPRRALSTQLILRYTRLARTTPLLVFLSRTQLAGNGAQDGYL